MKNREEVKKQFVAVIDTLPEPNRIARVWEGEFDPLLEKDPRYKQYKFYAVDQHEALDLAWDYHQTLKKTHPGKVGDFKSLKVGKARPNCEICHRLSSGKCDYCGLFFCSLHFKFLLLMDGEDQTKVCSNCEEKFLEESANLMELPMDSRLITTNLETKLEDLTVAKNTTTQNRGSIGTKAGQTVQASSALTLEDLLRQALETNPDVVEKIMAEHEEKMLGPIFSLVEISAGSYGNRSRIQVRYGQKKAKISTSAFLTILENYDEAVAFAQENELEMPQPFGTSQEDNGEGEDDEQEVDPRLLAGTKLQTPARGRTAQFSRHGSR